MLAPLVLCVTYAGGWLFLGLCAAAAVGILWEWIHRSPIAASRAFLRSAGPRCSRHACSTGVGQPGAAVLAIAAGAVLAGAVSVRSLGYGRGQRRRLGRAGCSMPGSPSCGPALLRRDPQWGFMALLFLFATVWATDIFAFLCGRAIGGPLLWPRVSPKKTWAGAIGGLAGGLPLLSSSPMRVGVRTAAAAGLMGLVLSILAQAGDLFEVGVKRRFGAKDASQLIPGHGGLMDRLDGFLVAAFAAAPHRHRAGREWMPRRAGCCYGRPMTQRQPLARAELARAPRAVSLLGATGSIGSSTIDLLRRTRRATASKR